jgi:Zn-dependent M28 family amino/carboxypeptidase
VSILASDDMAGRRLGTPGGASARRYLIDRLSTRAEPIRPGATGDDRYLQPIQDGANVLGIIRGTEHPDEYVIVGAHYDGQGTSCRTSVPGDGVCNSATDNAAGVAAALSIAQDLVDHPPRRSVVIALWDGEEANLRGSVAYVSHPVVPLAQTVAYVNFDVLGANLLPSLRDTTFAVGAETGGPVLTDIVGDAIDADTLDAAMVSAVMGAYRSDYTAFLNASIPTVFFSDSTGPCYHTPGDDLDAVDFAKLDHQVAIATGVVRALADGVERPSWTPAPLTTYDDVVAVGDVMDRSSVDWGRFSPADQQTLNAIRSDLTAVRDAGREAYDATAQSTLLNRANQGISVFTHGTCDGFLPPAGAPTG